MFQGDIAGSDLIISIGPDCFQAIDSSTTLKSVNPSQDFLIEKFRFFVDYFEIHTVMMNVDCVKPLQN
ncbi:MAG: hypothetical protein V8S95_03440 [Odoribacter sp.]